MNLEQGRKAKKPGVMRRVIKLLASSLILPAAMPAVAFEYDCMMEPHQVVEVKSTVKNRIETISVERSDFVRQGQPLVEFESDVEKASVALANARKDMRAELRSSKVSHKFAVRKLGRFGGLLEEGVVAAQTKDEVETEAALAELQIELARENRYLAKLELARAQALLDQHTVVSPIDGVVVNRYRSPGEFAGDGAIVELAQLNPLNVEVLLPASRFGQIKPGMRATVVPESPLDGRYSAEVKIVDRVVDASSGMFGVRLELPNPDNKLPGGLRCTVSFAESGGSKHSGNLPGKKTISTARAAQ